MQRWSRNRIKRNHGLPVPSPNTRNANRFGSDFHMCQPFGTDSRNWFWCSNSRFITPQQQWLLKSIYSTLVLVGEKKIFSKILPTWPLKFVCHLNYPPINYLFLLGQQMIPYFSIHQSLPLTTRQLDAPHPCTSPHCRPPCTLAACASMSVGASHGRIWPPPRRPPPAPLRRPLNDRRHPSLPDATSTPMPFPPYPSTTT